MSKKRKTKEQILEIIFKQGFRHPRKSVNKQTPSKKTFADFLEIHQSVVTKIVNGHAYACEHKHCLTVAAALGINADELPLDEKMLEHLKLIKTRIKAHKNKINKKYRSRKTDSVTKREK